MRPCSKGAGIDNFNPRTPRGVRLLVGELAKLLKQFQSTHPARGATHGLQHFGAVIIISIHAPREGCDFLPSRFFVASS